MELPLRFGLIMKLFKKKRERKNKNEYKSVVWISFETFFLQSSHIMSFIITLFNSFVIRFCSVQIQV